MMTKPLRPEDITEAKRAAVPDEVIEAFNELIAEDWSGTCATVSQDEVVERILSKLAEAGLDLTRDELFDKGWLDVEDIYRDDGWDVYYDKPGYNETYPATFRFSKPKEKTR